MCVCGRTWAQPTVLAYEMARRRAQICLARARSLLLFRSLLLSPCLSPPLSLARALSLTRPLARFPHPPPPHVHSLSHSFCTVYREHAVLKSTPHPTGELPKRELVSDRLHSHPRQILARLSPCASLPLSLLPRSLLQADCTQLRTPALRALARGPGGAGRQHVLSRRTLVARDRRGLRGGRVGAGRRRRRRGRRR